MASEKGVQVLPYDQRVESLAAHIEQAGCRFNSHAENSLGLHLIGKIV